MSVIVSRNEVLNNLCSKTLIGFCLHICLTCPGNYYGTPKPPAEPSPVQPDLVDQVLFDEEFDTEVQRKRTTSVSKMDRTDSTAPEEEEEEERPPMVNGVGGENLYSLLFYYIFTAFTQNSFQTSLYNLTESESVKLHIILQFPLFRTNYL